jgi:hypothetical protein
VCPSDDEASLRGGLRVQALGDCLAALGKCEVRQFESLLEPPGQRCF